MRVMHVITDLDVGGAEVMLIRLIEEQRRRPGYQHSVVSLKSVGEIGRKLEGLRVGVTALEMKSAADSPSAICRLARLVRKFQPAIVQTWMYHADFIGGLAARMAGVRRLVWCVHSTDIPQQGISVTGTLVWLCARLSRFLPDTIVCCAESARKAHEAKGYDSSKITVVPNGYDLRAFAPSQELRDRARAGFGFGKEDLVVGTVGRFDRLKDYPNFVQAAAVLSRKDDRLRFLMVGRGLETENEKLRGWLMERGIANLFVLAGERRDVASCLAAMDVFCLPSLAEAFPNVVCEAMAMKVPCVVTDVGDAARIVSGSGLVVAPCNAAGLAEGLWMMLSKAVEERAKLGELARERIENNYSIGNVTTKFEEIYMQVLGNSSQMRVGARARQAQ